MKIIIFDIDNTIAMTSGIKYHLSKPIKSKIKKINQLYERGYIIKIFTARYMGKHSGNIKLIKNKFYEILNKNFDDYKPITKISGSKILIAPPTLKVFKHYNYKVSQWISETVEKIKKFTDKEIVIRQKPKSRKIRINDDKFLDQLKKENIHCVVTFSSIIAIESILNGYPVITLGPNAASYLSESKIENIDNPYFPDDYKIKEHMLYLSACQFKKEDFSNGYALKTVNDLQYNQKHLDFKL